MKNGKTNLWNVRLSESDRKLLEMRAQQMGMNPASYFRWLLHQEFKMAISIKGN